MKHILKIAVCLATLAAADSSLATAAPLFASAEPLRLTIIAPMRELLRHREDKSDYPATMRYEDAAGNTHELPIMLAARGNSRLEVCDFPPLRVTVDKTRSAGTLFEDQRRLKMVTKCMRGRAARDWLLIEYGIYVANNEITDLSFRARRLEVTILEVGSERVVHEETAFFIESIGGAAKRLQRKSIRPPSVSADQYDITELAHNSLFQYLIGNTDFSVKRGPGGEGCCHNGRVVAMPGSQKNWVVLPYDFDQAGIMDTSYALPDKRFRIRKVTQRVYRGFCWHNDELTDSIALFNDRRDKIYAALQPSGLSDRKASKTRKYLDRFFATVNDPRDLQKDIFDDCRGSDSVPVRETTVSAN